MVAALGFALLVYLLAASLLIATAVVAIDDGDVVAAAGAIMFLAVIPVLLWAQVTKSAGPVIRALRARPDPRTDELLPVVTRLAALADISPPDVILARSTIPNALSVPTRGRALIIVTSGLLDALTASEVEAVLAHEVSHLANRDAETMVFVGGPALACAAMWNSSEFRGRVGAVLVSPFWLIALVVMRSFSRSREFAADHGSALLTGAPEELMSALQTISGNRAIGDLRGGFAVSALCVVGRSDRWVLADHPPLEKRLAALAELARELGRPAPPRFRLGSST